MKINVIATAANWSHYSRHIEHANEDKFLNQHLPMGIVATLKLKEDEQGLETWNG